MARKQHKRPRFRLRDLLVTSAVVAALLVLYRLAEISVIQVGSGEVPVVIHAPRNGEGGVSRIRYDWLNCSEGQAERLLNAGPWTPDLDDLLEDASHYDGAWRIRMPIATRLGTTGRLLSTSRPPLLLLEVIRKNGKAERLLLPVPQNGFDVAIELEDKPLVAPPRAEK